MVEEGWAWHYKRYSRDADLAAAEVQAREKKAGCRAGSAVGVSAAKSAEVT